MVRARSLSLFLALSLLGNAFSVPTDVLRLRRGYSDNELDSLEAAAPVVRDLVAEGSERRTRQDDEAVMEPAPEVIKDIFGTPPAPEEEPTKLNLIPDSTTQDKTEAPTPDPFDDDDDDFDEPINTSPTSGGGSNLFSLLRIAGALFPGSSGANAWQFLNYLQEYLIRNQGAYIMRRHDVTDNIIVDDDVVGLKPPPFQRQETEETESESESESTEEIESESTEDTEEDVNNAAEESIEKDNGDKANNDNASVSKSKQDSGSKAESNSDGDSEDDSDEPPGGGDGQGGGILGVLAGLSGGEDGQSDLGSLLAAVGGIVANLSGDGIDINALIASGLGLFVGLLSEGNENPGEVIASYLLTSLDSLSGGGSSNNGAFFGSFLSKLIKGTSAFVDPDASSEENGEVMKDSSGFFSSFLVGLFGDMSKGSSGGSSGSSHRRQAFMMR